MKILKMLNLCFQTRILMTMNEALAVCYPEVSIKNALGMGLTTNTLSTLGTERHRHVFEAVWNKKVLHPFLSDSLI